MHSHADGLMHIHPYSSDEAGKHATVGQFLKEGGWKVSSDSLQVWDNKTHKNGQKCDGKEATVRYAVNGDEKDGNPGSYHPEDGDVVAIAFLPKDAKIGTPPQASAVPNDVEPSAQTTLPGASGLPEAPSTTTPGATTPGSTTAGSTTPGAETPGSTTAGSTTETTVAGSDTTVATTVPSSTSAP
jgi:hypothetical protein